MHKDTKEALERLEAELLAQETPEMDDEELDALLEDFLEEDDGEEYADLSAGYQNYANGYSAYNSDDTDEDLDQYSDEVYEDRAQRSTGLLVMTLVTMATAVAALVYIVVRSL